MDQESLRRELNKFHPVTNWIKFFAFMPKKTLSGKEIGLCFLYKRVYQNHYHNEEIIYAENELEIMKYKIIT